MIQKNDKVYLVAAAACGLLAAASAALYLKVKTPEPVRTTRVLVANADLPANHRLAEGDLREIELPVIDESVERTLMSSEHASLLLGRTLSMPAPAGLFLTEQLFTPMQSFTIAPGMRGFAITPRTPLLLAPGQFVDVYVCVPRAAEPAPTAARGDGEATLMEHLASLRRADDAAVEPRLILERVIVKAVGTRLKDDQTTMGEELDDGGRTSQVMIEVTPEDARRLLAESRGLSLPLTLLICDGRAREMAAR